MSVKNKALVGSFDTALQLAEEKRRDKEQRLFMRQQQKIARLQQMRMEREVRTQQLIEV